MSGKSTFFYILLWNVIFLSSSLALYSFESKILNEEEYPSPVKFIDQPFDVLHYDAWLDLTQSPGKAMHGICDIIVHWKENPQGKKFMFHLRDLVVDSVFYQNQRVEAIEVYTPDSATYHYEIITPPENEEDTITIRIYYHGEMQSEKSQYPWGGVQSMDNTLFSLGVGFLNNYVCATQHWLPCFDLPQDKATFRGQFQVKADKSVASNGLLAVRQDRPEYKVYEWVHNYPSATYNLTFAVHNYTTIEYEKDGLKYMIFTLPADSVASAFFYKKLPDMVKCYESFFVKYPFEKVGYVNTPRGAMEHQTMVSFPVSLVRSGYQSGDSINTIVAHELSHHWFGDLVTCRDFRDTWLNEGFATFCESLWLEYINNSFESYLQHQETMVNRYINTIIQSEGAFPLYDYPRALPSSNYPETIYKKGAVVLGMLRYELGDEAFFEAVRNYLNNFAYSVATTDDLRKEFEKASGQDLEWFFQQWVLGKGHPTLDVKIEIELKEGGQYSNVRITLKQDQPKSYGFYQNLPVEIGFMGVEGGNIFKLVRMTEFEQTFYFENVPQFSHITFNQGPTLRALFNTKRFNISYVEAREVDVEKGLKVFPVPTADVVRIGFDSEAEPQKLAVFDKFGRKLMEIKDFEMRGDGCVELDISLLQSGVYFIELQYKGNTQVGKFVKI